VTPRERAREHLKNAIQVLSDRLHEIELSPEGGMELEVSIAVRNRIEAALGMIQEVVDEPHTAARAMKARALL